MISDARYSDIVPLLLVMSIVTNVVGMVLNLGLNWILRYVDKLVVYGHLTIAIAVVAMALLVASLRDSAEACYTFVALVIVLAALSSPIYTIDTLLVRDLVIYDTFVTGINRENMYQAAVDLPTSLATTVFDNIPSMVLHATGFVSGTNAAEDDQLISRFIWDDVSL